MREVFGLVVIGDHSLPVVHLSLSCFVPRLRPIPYVGGAWPSRTFAPGACHPCVDGNRERGEGGNAPGHRVGWSLPVLVGHGVSSPRERPDTWWVPRPSKPLRGRNAAPGGFDSHPLPFSSRVVARTFRKPIRSRGRSVWLGGSRRRPGSRVLAAQVRQCFRLKPATPARGCGLRDAGLERPAILWSSQEETTCDDVK